MTRTNQAPQSERDFLNRNAFGKDVLHQAISSGNGCDFKEIIRRVKEERISLAGKDYLNWAVQYRRHEFVAPLIASGCIPYLSNGHDMSILDYAVKSRDRRLLVDVINACQRIPTLMSSDSMGDKRLLTSPYSQMTGKERVIALIMIVGMDFNSLSFYVTEISPVIAYSIYNDISLKALSEMTNHGHVKDMIKQELSSTG